MRDWNSVHFWFEPIGRYSRALWDQYIVVVVRLCTLCIYTYKHHRARELCICNHNKKMTNIYKAFNGTPQCDSNYVLGWFVGSVQKAMILIVTPLVRTNGFEPNANKFRPGWTCWRLVSDEFHNVVHIFEVIWNRPHNAKQTSIKYYRF